MSDDIDKTTEEKSHKIIIEMVLFGKFNGDLPMETALRTRLWNAARSDGKFEVKFVDLSIGEIVKTIAVCETEDDEKTED